MRNRLIQVLIVVAAAAQILVINKAQAIEGITYDLGASAGSSGGVTYSEVNFGVNTFFTSYFAWRNAAFARFPDRLESLYGLDSSLRGILDLSAGVAGFTVFGGPGYRFVSRGDNVPFLEGGAVVHVIGLSIGGGVKTFMTSAVREGAPNDTQYFLILAGGGSI